MKKITIILLFIFCFNSIETKAQYVPLIVDSTHYFTSIIPSATPPPYEHFEYLLLGDTVISSITYKKVYYRTETNSTGPKSMTTPFSLEALLREDTTNKKVYAILYRSFDTPCPINQEILLYDFDLQLGDTLFPSNVCIFPAPQVVGIIYPTTYWLNSTEYGTNNYYLTQGLGHATQGLFISQCLCPIAFLQDYCRGGLSNCKYPTGIAEKEKNKKINIYPNPTTNKVTFELSNSNFNLSLTNITGKQVYTQKVNSTSVKVDVSQYSKGIYFYHIVNDDGSYSGKLIVQ